jgi:hypothetical protein
MNKQRMGRPVGTPASAASAYLPNWLTQRLRDLPMTGQELARRLGLNGETVRLWMSGKASDPSGIRPVPERWWPKLAELLGPLPTEDIPADEPAPIALVPLVLPRRLCPGDWDYDRKVALRRLGSLSLVAVPVEPEPVPTDTPSIAVPVAWEYVLRCLHCGQAPEITAGQAALLQGRRIGHSCGGQALVDRTAA